MAYEKQNFLDGQIVTSDHLNHMENGIIAAGNVQNLLDNSDFTNPVNQRSFSSTTLNDIYCIDRWKTESANNAATISLVSGGITLIPTSANYVGITQMLENYDNMAGNVYTIAVCVGDTWDCASITIGNEPSGKTLASGVTVYSIPTEQVLIRNQAGNNPITVQKVALYDGAHTADTLPSYVPKGIMVEMINCGVPLNPRNLLDNSDFTNPINQRGQTSYQTPWNMTIDRWYLSSYDESNANLTLTTNGIVITPGTSGSVAIAQRIPSENLHANKTYTAFAQTLDGTYVTGTVENHTDTYGFYQVGFKVSTETTLVWAALYEGSYDVSTLPSYQPKGYAAELAECQRYYYVIPSGGAFIFRKRNEGTSAYGAYDICPSIVFPQQMRVTPSVTINYDITDGSMQSGSPLSLTAASCSMPNVSIPVGGWFDFNKLVASADL